MEEFKNKITKLIEYKRNIKSNSLNTYINNLKNLLLLDKKKIDYEELLKILKKPEKIFKLLENKKITTQRNYYAAVVVFLKALDNEKLTKIYSDKMIDLLNQNNEVINSNKKNESQNKNWTSLKKLRQVVNDYKKELEKREAFKKDTLNKKEFETLQKYTIGAVYTLDPVNNPPLRNDYIMKIINEKDYLKLDDEEIKKNNYLVIKSIKTKYFILGNYKTDKKFGIKKIKVGSKLNKVLNLWLKYNKTGHLFLDTRGQPITPPGINKLLARTFEPTGKQIGSTMLRHIIISELFPPQTTERQKTADLMLHSRGMQGQYAKE